MKLDLSILDGSRLSNSTRAEAGLVQDVSTEGLAQQFPLPAVKDVSVHSSVLDSLYMQAPATAATIFCTVMIQRCC